MSCLCIMRATNAAPGLQGGMDGWKDGEKLNFGNSDFSNDVTGA